MCANLCAFILDTLEIIIDLPFGFFSINNIISLLDTGDTQDMISFDGRAGLLTENSPTVSCEKECSGASDEGIYEYE